MFRNKANFYLEGLRKTSEKFQHLIFNARGRGLMCAFDLPDGKARADFQEKLFEEHVIVLICGEKSIKDSVHIDVYIKKTCNLLWIK